MRSNEPGRRSCDVVRERHARAYLALAHELAPALIGDDQRVALDRLGLEHANVRAAIDWGVAHARADVALGILVAVWRMWQKRGDLREARIRVGDLIARPWFADAPPDLRASGHEVMGGIIYWHGDVDGARPDYEAALAIWREVGDRREIANACYNLSFVFTMGVLQELPVDAEQRADGLLVEALSIYRSLGDDLGEANVHWGIATQHFFARDDAAAASAFDSALALYRKLGDRTQEAWSLHMLGSARLRLGQVDVARGQLADGLRLFMEAGDVAGVTLGLDDLAAIAVNDGDFVRAARLSGLARRIEASSGTGLAGVTENVFEMATRADTGGAMRPEDLARYEAEGAALPINDGVRYALGEIEIEAVSAVNEPA